MEAEMIAIGILVFTVAFAMAYLCWAALFFGAWDRELRQREGGRDHAPPSD